MTRINLLPPEKVKERRPRARAPKAPPTRSMWWLIILLPLIIGGAMGYWWYSMSGDLDEQEQLLTKKETELKDWKAKNKELEQYKSRLDEIAQLENVVVQVLDGRVYWARILNEIAIMCPSDIWLTSLSGSSEPSGEGDVTFTGYALQCPNRLIGGFYPYYPDYKPIAYWLERMVQILEFEKVWLSSAEPVFIESGGAWVIDFDSSATLDPDTSRVVRTGGEQQ